ncbi:Hypothetical protein CINCED_3A012115, partial [Cinara cedri]
CVGDSTDEAANIQGDYRGFSVQLSNVAKIQIHIWCYAHFLNLVIGDVTLEYSMDVLFLLKNLISVSMCGGLIKK